jgi:cytochrome c oxidase subunit I+III
MLSLGSIVAGLAGPWQSGLDPASDSYAAIVWTLAIWTVVHSGIAAITQLYGLARSVAGRTTPRHDADIRNITLYQHFMLFTAGLTWITLGLFPEVA